MMTMEPSSADMKTEAVVLASATQRYRTLACAAWPSVTPCPPWLPSRSGSNALRQPLEQRHRGPELLQLGLGEPGRQCLRDALRSLVTPVAQHLTAGLGNRDHDAAAIVGVRPPLGQSARFQRPQGRAHRLRA